MAGERDGMDPDEPSGDGREFRRMLDSLGHEGFRRIIEHLTEKIQANPGDAESLFLRGLAYGELGEHRRAVEDFGRAIALEPANVEALRQRATLYRDLGEPDKAVRDYDEIIRLEPNDPSVGEERELAVKESERR